MKAFRKLRDAADIIADLERRIATLETARRISSASIDGGELSVRGGDIVVRGSNDEPTLSIKHGDIPEIDMQPNAEVFQDYRLKMFGWESGGQGAALQLSVAQLNGDNTDTQDGGKVLLMRDVTYLSHQPKVGNETFISMNAADTECFQFQGKWPNASNYSHDALSAGSVAVAAGFGSIAITYTTPFATTACVVYGLVNTAGAVTHSLTAQSTAGFTVTWSGTLAKVLNWWTFRV